MEEYLSAYFVCTEILLLVCTVFYLVFSNIYFFGLGRFYCNWRVTYMPTCI